MCGIIGYTGARLAAPLLVEGLRRLEYRGYDSAGVALIDPSRNPPMVLTRCEGKIAALAAKLEAEPLSGTTGIGHTRWATHGRPCEANAHPHRAGRVCVVHNGIIENHAKQRAALQARGRSFSSETDTEIIAHLIDERYAAAGDGDLLAAVRSALAELEGAYAICVVHDEHPRQLVAARHASPLLVGLGDRDAPAGEPESFVASDVAAILEHTRTVIDLDDGDIVRVGPEGIEVHLDAAGEAVTRRPRHIDWSPLAAEKQGFKHFMLKEIFEQPRAVRDTLIGRLRGAEELDFGELAGVDLPELAAHHKLTIVACGTSWHAALAGKYLIEQLARVPVEVDLASEFRYRVPIVRGGDLVLAISQSGETADTKAALEEAQRLGAKGLAICNVVDSSIARLADHVLYTHAGPEISVASTKAFTTQLTMLTMLAIHLGRGTGALAPERAHALLEGLREMPVAIDAVLGVQSAIKIIARRWVSARDWLYLGRGLSFPVALEGALKLKEISYVHAEGYASGELKHGPIALIDEGVPVVVLALEGPAYDKTLSNLEEVRSRGGKIIAVATAGDERIGDVADDVILVPKVDPFLQPILASVPLQLLAYHVADIKGTDVDQPRNLAKSVTVE
ncbi:glutamine--fructose-6-phosphate transaminase (isomerizing) [Pseudenhygromyxa sp. WMMC2535]|uniref:glutamine--fructose-6-phosphate transaminase (isomerizing) n=1 Tax=Pseudenhygromyxa sp. WMMC2535 TaxID=2712867 RepID=UPI0015529EF3|nr:glutamine--fructose-6-phosphate transaminase (isomerizing) [Pseudenhygromyxa sp. WMMC2535]NVB37373.1 glutamine--fructose-6-phosphate transaminase (isomerizing) [Pseudenhygromyxa sp. WMMC2535]